MPQIQLPVFPASSTAITDELAFEQRDGQVYYFNGHLAVSTHPVDDKVIEINVFSPVGIEDFEALVGPTFSDTVIEYIERKFSYKNIYLTTPNEILKTIE